MLYRFISLALFSSMLIPAMNTIAQVTSVHDIISCIDNIPCYKSDARFTVTMPQLTDDVVYNLSIEQQSDDNDPLSPCSYLIEWTTDGANERLNGFSAYFSGNHYRFSGERLQEYHMTWDSIPFRPVPRSDGRATVGVHQSAQFVNTLPASIAAELHKMQSDSLYTLHIHPDTLISGKHRIVIDAVMRTAGMTAMEGEYVFDRNTGMPVRVRLENNPGSISEQSVSIEYTGTTIQKHCPALSEHSLMERYPTAFERYRESNFRIENLPGSRLPAFALPTTTGERYSRRAADAFRSPTIVALLEAGTGFSRDLVSQLRKAVDMLPYPADIIWAFTDKHVDNIEEVVPEIRPGEHLLMSARPLARDCGAASLPVVILVQRDGTVSNVILGYNNELASDVIQKMALMKP